ncbi:MAG: SUMF1/EgtB/PvdO family nonheme iron enzyme [Puniceicoccales bacterium]|nr:SUMF1/EgtB/PvdO family nonheme iron enzyme [Puniceicoccales bacterium]
MLPATHTPPVPAAPSQNPNPPKNFAARSRGFVRKSLAGAIGALALLVGVVAAQLSLRFAAPDDAPDAATGDAGAVVAGEVSGGAFGAKTAPSATSPAPTPLASPSAAPSAAPVNDAVAPPVAPSASTGETLADNASGANVGDAAGSGASLASVRFAGTRAVRATTTRNAASPAAATSTTGGATGAIAAALPAADETDEADTDETDEADASADSDVADDAAPWCDSLSATLTTGATSATGTTGKTRLERVFDAIRGISAETTASVGTDSTLSFDATAATLSDTGDDNTTTPSVLAAPTLPAPALPATALYVVIDLSGGTSAASYPVAYLDDVPAGGWTDEYKTTKLVLRRIPAGTFTMGSPTGEVGRSNDETQHSVTLTQDYYIGVFPVTQKQYELVVGKKPSYFSAGANYGKRPVENVSWNDVTAAGSGFLSLVSAKTKLNFALPTEAQWEYACRAGTTTALNRSNSGKNLTDTTSDSAMDSAGRYYYNGGSGFDELDTTGAVGTAFVGSYAANAWGLYDFHGNVWEWCADWYDSYERSAVVDPVGPVSGVNRVVRGGSWHNNAANCRSASRGYSGTSSLNVDGYANRGSGIGFRVACVSASITPPPAETTYTLTVKNGSVVGTTDTKFSAGAEVFIAADVAPVGYRFVNWKSTAGGVFADATAASTTFIMPANATTITANYEQDGTTTYVLTVSGGTIAGTGGKTTGNFAAGTVVSIVAGTAPGSRFVNWTNADGVVFANAAAASTTFIMPAKATTISANYKYYETDVADYVIIDLSGGASATTYPVSSFRGAEPDGGWSDEDKTTKLVLRRIPAGTFTMGSPSNERGRWYDESQHSVTLTHDYYIGVFPVTQEQYELVVGNNPAAFSAGANYGKRPVENVSWNDVTAAGSGFLARISAKTGLDLTLPTEAQWEYACRAGTTSALNSGIDLTSTTSDSAMDSVGRYYYNGGSGYSYSDTTGAVGTAFVGSYAPNAWGLYDFHGNVWEWCADWYDSYETSAVVAPAGPVSGANRVLRGGGWGCRASEVRSASRSSAPPSNRASGFGFRVVLTLP